MSPSPSAIVVCGNGINCEQETAYACRCAGFGTVDIVAIWELMNGRVSLQGYDLLVFPGGFLDGDELGAAKAQVDRFMHMRTPQGSAYIAEIISFVKAGKCVLGICNGFQLLVKLGLLPALGGEYGTQTVTLTHNDGDKFEDRWVHLQVNPETPSIFLQGLTRLYLPVRNGEGKLVVDDNSVIAHIKEMHHIALFYTDPAGQSPTMEYPHNPSGSQAAIAALSDTTGRVLGLMPHPEAYIDRLQHPRWTREQLAPRGDGYKLFENACTYCRSLQDV